MCQGLTSGVCLRDVSTAHLRKVSVKGHLTVQSIVFMKKKISGTLQNLNLATIFIIITICQPMNTFAPKYKIYVEL